MQSECQRIEVSAPQEFILGSSKSRNLFMGGTGSGKSHVISILSGYIITNFPDIIQFIGANTYGQLSLSTLKRVFDTWKKVFGWIEGIHFVVGKIPPDKWPMFGAKLKDYNNVITFNNGAMIFTASLENFRAIDGTEFCIAYLDETKDTKEEAVKEVIVNRLRQSGLYIFGQSLIDQKKVDEYLQDGFFENKDGKIYQGEAEIIPYNALFIFTSPAKVDWLNKWFKLSDHYEEIQRKIFSKTDFFSYEDDQRCISISSTYHNEHNLPANYISQLLSDYEGNKNLSDVYIYGSPIAKTGGEFIDNFNRLEHIKDVGLNESLPIHLSFDFNVIPHCTCLVSQVDIIQEEKIIYWNIIDSYPHKGKKRHNNTESLCEQILSDYAGLVAGTYFYGDSTGDNRRTVSKDIKTDYQTVERVLSPLLGSKSNRVSRNPSLKNRGVFLNKLFSGTPFRDGWKVIVRIHKKNDALLDDLEFSKADVNGHLIKEEGLDEATAVRCQKRGHYVDCALYQAVGIFKGYFETFNKK